MSRKSKPQNKQRRSGWNNDVALATANCIEQKPLDPQMSEQEAAAILANPAQHSALEMFRALAARGLCEMFGSLDNPTIRLSPTFRDFVPGTEQAEQ